MRNTRRLLMGLALPVLLGLALLLQSCESTPSTSETPDAAGTETSEPTLLPTSTLDPVGIVVEGGDVIGPSQITVAQGDRLAIEIEADVEDEVHVHTYDLFAEVSPGEKARLEFRATIPGIFEIELEDAGLLLTSLKVTA